MIMSGWRERIDTIDEAAWFHDHGSRVRVAVCIALRLCRSFSAFRRFVEGSSSLKGFCPAPGEWITH